MRSSSEGMHALRCSDVDAVDLSLWVQKPTPFLPKVVARQTVPKCGGRLAILRDVSGSMDGPHAMWASAVVSSLLRMCRQRSLAVGYLEFNHEPIMLRSEYKGIFFTREYDRLQAAAQTVWGDGGTNLQLALRAVLTEFARLPSSIGDTETMRQVGCQMYQGLLRVGNPKTVIVERLAELGVKLPSETVFGRQHLRTSQRFPTSHTLLVTDGVPTLGCKELLAECKEACAMGLCVHTVFIGDEPTYPQALSTLARATGGVRFQAVLDRITGQVQLYDCGRSQAEAV